MVTSSSVIVPTISPDPFDSSVGQFCQSLQILCDWRIRGLFTTSFRITPPLDNLYLINSPWKRLFENTMLVFMFRILKWIGCQLHSLIRSPKNCTCSPERKSIGSPNMQTSLRATNTTRDVQLIIPLCFLISQPDRFYVHSQQKH